MTTHDRTSSLRGREGGPHVADAGGDRPRADKLVAFGRDRPGITIVAPEITMGLPEPARVATNVSMAWASVRVPATSPTVGTTGQVDDAVAVEGPGSQDVGVVQVAAQDIGAHARHCLSGGVRAS